MKTLCLLLYLLSMSSLCYADRDIVYAARYYAPPGSHRISHFHLYRINPDGTGKTQITFGTADDRDPKWSPDGKYIAFTRQPKGGSGIVCLIRANGGAIRKLIGLNYGEYSWSPDGHYFAIENSATDPFILIIEPKTGKTIRRFASASDFLWSPDGKHGYVCYDNSNQIIDMTNSTQSAVRVSLPLDATPLGNMVWSDNQTLVEVGGDFTSEMVYLWIFGLKGREIRHVLCRWGQSTKNPFSNSVDPWGHALLSPPYAGHSVVYEQDEGISGTRPDNAYYFADTLTGQMTKITDGQFLIWSSDNVRFCTSEARHLMNYGKPVNDYQKSLYVSSLQVGQKAGGSLRDITPGLSWVTGADWRKDK